MKTCAKCGGSPNTELLFMRNEIPDSHPWDLCTSCVIRISAVIEQAIEIHPNALVDSGEPYVAGMSGKATGRGDAKI